MAREAGARGRPLRRREVTRERILDAAEDVFLARGFAAATVQEIAKAADYTTGALYSNFGSKAELFLEVFRRRQDVQDKVWRQALDSIVSSDDVAAAMGPALREATYEPDWYAAVFEFYGFVARDDELRPKAGELLQKFEPVLSDLFTKIGNTSSLPDDRLAAAITGLMRGLAWTWVVVPEETDDSLFADAVAVLIGAAEMGRPAKTKRPNKSAQAKAPRRDAPGTRKQ